jgi:hypothetical protein
VRHARQNRRAEAPGGLAHSWQTCPATAFAASTAGLAAALATAPASMILLLSTVVTVGGAAAGAFLCVLWFIRVLRRFGLHVRFTQA